jgi:hypothetical protein
MISLRQAINAKCKDCIYDPLSGLGTWREQVARCTAVLQRWNQNLWRQRAAIMNPHELLREHPLSELLPAMPPDVKSF